MGSLDKIKRIVAEAENIVFFSGAGISTDSGIPDFRGNGGLYTSADEEFDDPVTILRGEYLMHCPDSFYRYYRSKMLHPYAEPNAAHFALARLEKSGKLSAVITQNIDGLHQAAGSKNVIELHGSVHRNYCVRCGKSYSLDYILDNDGVVYCDACCGLVRPDVVMYGESLNNEAFSRAQDAIYEADVMIVGGTSLTVNPAASLVADFGGEHLIIINSSPTPYDEYAEFVIRKSLSAVLPEIFE